MDKVLHGIGDGNYPVASPPDEHTEQPGVGAVAQRRVHRKKGKRKSADSPPEQQDKEPLPSEDEITEKGVKILPGEAARRPSKQQK